MGTRYCPECGSEYVATVTQCVDCLVPLLDDVEYERRSAEQGDGGAPGEQIVYELADWDPDQRVLLARILDSEGIAHVWEATDLVVRQADETRIEALMDDLEVRAAAREDADDDAAAGDDEQVVYELSDWAPELRERLVALLEESAIAYSWDENGDLVVEGTDEDAVDRFLDELEHPGALEEDDGGGTEGQEVMSALFVAADRLVHDPEDHNGVFDIVEGAERAEAIGPPYGFEARVWAGIVERATAVRQAIEADADADELVELARELRTTLRQYV